MGVSAGDRLILRYQEGVLSVMTAAQSIRFAQSLVRRYIKKDRSLAEELIAERKEEFPNE